MIAARRLGEKSFGELAVIQSTVNMFGVFASFGMGWTATKYIAEFRLTNPAKAGRILALSTAVAIVTAGSIALVQLTSASWQAEYALAAPHLTGLLQISALLLFFNALCSAQTGALAGFEAFQSVARINLLVGLGTFLLLVGGVYWAGLEGVVWALIIGQVINWLLNHLALRAEAARTGVPFSFSGCRQEWKMLYNFSLPSVLIGATAGPVNWICNALLVNQPNGYMEMGIFNAANQWRQVILFVPSMVGIAVFPILSNLYGAGDQASYSKVFRYGLLFNGTIILTVAVPIAGLASFIMAGYGQGFAERQEVLVWLVMATVANVAANVICQSLMSVDRMWAVFYLCGLYSLTLIGSTLFLVALKNLNASSLALATMIAYIVHFTSAGIFLIRGSKTLASSNRINSNAVQY